MARRFTIHDLAARAGVSVSTIDRILNGRSEVRAATGQRVLEAAEAMGFYALPALRQRLQALQVKYKFDPRGHTGKALGHAIESLPHDIAISIDDAALEDLALAAMSIADRPRPMIELVEALEEDLAERSVGFRIEDEDLVDLKTVRDAVERAERMANHSVSRVWIGCSGAGLASTISRVEIDIGGRRIEQEDIDQLLASAREKLFAARDQRIRPGRDDKILTSWNALMIEGMAHAGRVCGRDDWLSVSAMLQCPCRRYDRDTRTKG